MHLHRNARLSGMQRARMRGIHREMEYSSARALLPRLGGGSNAGHNAGCYNQHSKISLKISLEGK
jgi:hypothetical protein